MSFLVRLEKLKNKDTLIPLISVLILVGMVALDKLFWGDHIHVDLVGDYFVWGTLFFIMVFVVGFAAMKALVHISAGLSLVVFLAQSYCAVSTHTDAGNSSLKFLLTIALIYLVFDFLSIFYNAIKEYLDIIKKPKKEYFWKFLFICIFIFTIFIVLMSVYYVIKPILLDLCIYKVR